MMKHTLFFAAVIFSLYGKAQTYSCGFDALRQAQQQIDPSYNEKEAGANHLLYRQAISPAAAERAIRYIPVVVHVVHQNGVENITDSAVIAGINQLNLRFQNAAPYTHTTGNDVQIRFCLASVDPFGNPATGITRTVSSLTDLSFPNPGDRDLSLKNLNRWSPNLYMNIWIIKYTGSGTVAGYATYPSSAGSGYDGIVIQYNYYNTSALAHEAGHYLGLHHTFMNGCANNNCLLDGDMVCDTPPDATSDFTCPVNSCNTEMNDTSGFNPFAGDVNDAPNYMDYTNCSLSFTAGQSSRMNSSLTLLRSTLLQSNGCGQNPGGAIPAAAFTAAPACGGTLLNNTSTNAVGAQWDFNGDGLIDDAGNTFTYNAPATGYYNVTMYAQGYGGMDTISQTIFMQNYPYQNYPMINGFSGLVLLPAGGFGACGGSVISFNGTPGMAHYYWSNGDTTQNTTFIQGTDSYDISLTTIDAAGLTWTTCYPVHVQALPAPVPPTITLNSGDSVFCIGNTVNLSFTYSPIWASGNFGSISGFHYTTYSPVLTNFNNFSVNQTDANGCVSTSNIVSITAYDKTYPAAIVHAGGNYLLAPTGAHYEWYLDGVAIPGSDVSLYEMTMPGCYKVYSWWYAYACGSFSSDSVCIGVGLDENAVLENSILISPNPFSSQTTISFSETQDHASLKIIDLLGKEVKALIVSGKQVTLEKEDISKGIYYLQFSNGKYVINKKIVIH